MHINAAMAMEAHKGASNVRPATSAQGRLGAVRALHHTLAQAWAGGASWRDLAALATAYSGRPWLRVEVERLISSPAFRELASRYGP